MEKILSYKSKARMVWDILFKPSRVREEIYSTLQKQREELEISFQSKIIEIGFDHYKKAIVSSSHTNPVFLLEVPISSDDRYHIHAEEKKVDRMSIAFTSSFLTMDQIKRSASHVLADKLIEEGFLQSKVGEGAVMFYVNAFGL